MLQYSPDFLQWFLLTGSSTVGRGLFILSFLILIYSTAVFFFPERFGLKASRREPSVESDEAPLRPRSRKEKSRPSLWVGIAGLVLMALSLVPFQFAEPETLKANIAKELSATANFSEIKLLQIDIVSQSPISESSIVYIGTAIDVDGDPRQFRYTQYEKFGVYEMVGFDKPAVDLKDESFKSTEKSIEIYKDPESTSSPTANPSPKSSATSTPKASSSAAPRG